MIISELFAAHSPGKSFKSYYRLTMLVILCITYTGCASWNPPSQFDISELRSRAVSEEKKGVRVSATVLSHEDTLQLFDADINDEEVQSIWIEVENNTQQTLWLLRTGTDPDIFSPLEVSWSFHKTFAKQTNAQLDDHFDSQSFQNPVPPNSTRSGVLFTNPHKIIRLLNVDLLGQGELFPFTLFPLIPDDGDSKRTHNLFAQLEKNVKENYTDMAALRGRLEKLPCCTSSANGTNNGPPLNVVMIGRIEDISAAAVRRGFRVNILERDNLYHVYNRPPDVVIRKSGQGGVPANWLRAWVAPFRFQDQSVLLVQTGRPNGGRFSDPDDPFQELHPNVDEMRNVLVGDVVYSGGLGKLAFITGAGEVAEDKPRKTFDGAGYFTDGIRAVMFFVKRPRSISDVKFLEWYPAIKIREKNAATMNHRK